MMIGAISLAAMRARIASARTSRLELLGIEAMLDAARKERAKARGRFVAMDDRARELLRRTLGEPR